MFILMDIDKLTHQKSKCGFIIAYNFKMSI